jgi:membrane protein DedA with SNARE-associated domain
MEYICYPEGLGLMSVLISQTVQFIAHHAAWTFPIMFLAAFGESFVFVSLIFPGTTIMIAAGLLVPNGTLPLFPLLSGAILGAVLGDAISWWLGLRFGPRIRSSWPFSRNPALLDHGEALFRRFGSSSVFIGRFFGPFRASVPLIAGIMKMPSLQFWIANVASALVWAPALLVPGSAAVLLSRWSGFGIAGQIAIIVGLLLAGAAAVWAWERSKLFRSLETVTDTNPPEGKSRAAKTANDR